MSDLPYSNRGVNVGSMPVDKAHLVARMPNLYLMSDIREALRVLSHRIRAMEATVITGCACCDEDQPAKALSPEELFEVMEGR